MLDHVTVQDWMTAPVISVTPDTPISVAHQLMKEQGVRRLPVLRDEQLVGIITVGDLREAGPSAATSLSIWELNYLWAQLTVKQIMSTRLVTVRPDTPIIDAAELMLEHKVGGLPVVDAHNHLVGILTESDIFKMLVKSRSVALVPLQK